MKKGALFMRPLNEVIHLIEVQGSRQNNAEEASFTINVAVFIPTLIYEDMLEFTRPSVANAHWRERLGRLTPDSTEAWWSARTTQDAERNASEIAALVTEFALPALADILSLKAIQVLWSSGLSPGLTDKQRTEYLARLNTGTRCNAGAA